MATLTVWAFGSADGAERALHLIERWQDEGTDPLDDVAVVTWPTGEGRPSAWQERCLAGPDVLSGAFWGMLIGIAFLLPLADPQRRPPENLLVAVGLGEEFLRELTDRIVPGRSALFLLARRATPGRVTHALLGRGAQPIEVHLDGRQWGTLTRVFAAEAISASDDGSGAPPR